MKTIADLKGGEFLRACNGIRYAVADLLKKSNAMEILKQEPPQFTGTETEEEKEKILTENGKQKFNRILDVLLDEYADETAAVLEKMCIVEDGEDIGGIDLVITALDVVTTPKMMDFFIRLMQSVRLLGGV